MHGYKDYKEILIKYKQMLLEKLGDNLISLVLYGSVARGTAKDESDIDLLIVLKDAPDSYYERLEPVVEIELKMRRIVSEYSRNMPILSSMILSVEEAMEDRNIFLDMIDASIILYDKDDFFKNRLSGLEKRLAQAGTKKVYLADNTWYWNIKHDTSSGEAIEL